MKKAFILFFLAFHTFFLQAQLLKIETGITRSNLDWILTNVNNESIIDKPLYTPNLSIGIDYWNKKHFNLTSNMGFVIFGGTSKFDFVDVEGNIIEKNKKSSDYLQQLSLNSSIELKYPIKNFTPFIVLGGFYNLNLKLSNSFEALEEITEIHNLYGVLSGLGVKLKIKKSEFGIKGQLYSPLNNLANWNTSFSNNNSISAKAVNVNLFYSYPIWF